MRTILKGVTRQSKVGNCLTLLLLTVCCGTNLPGIFAQTAFGSKLFDFHGGIWINLHHFLYRQALLTQPHKGPGALALSDIDSTELQHLSTEERAAWNGAVSYYASSWVNRDLLFDDKLISIKNHLEDAEDSASLTGVEIPAELKAVLVKAAPIYKKHWWPRHDAQNRGWVAQLNPLLNQYGSGLAERLDAIYDRPWPQDPVRVDVVAYANWAGAYTTLFPTRPTISTTDPANQGTAALEIVFHETSHGLMDNVQSAIGLAESDLNAHRPNGAFHSGSIWHAILFFTAGELVAEQIPGYVPYADKNGLWTRAWPDPDRALIEKDWKPHMDNSVGLQPALSHLVNHLAEANAR
jgi:hypothetical protein